MKEQFKEILLPDRFHTNSRKWDNLAEHFEQGDLLPMWIADMDFKAPECVRQALHDYVDQGAFGYYRVPDAYFENFIRWEESHHGYAVQREWIRFAPGIVSCLHWLTSILTQPGDAVLLQTPVYYPFHAAVTDTGRTLIESPLVNDHNVYSVDFADFERQIAENNVRLFIMSSPHNPVGRVWTREELKKMLEICRKHQVYVLADEIHKDILLHGAKHTPAATMGDYDSFLITLAAGSKTFNLAGCQNSYIIIPDARLRRKYDEYLKYLRIYCGNSFGYVAMEAAFAGGEEWLAAVLEEIEGNYDYMQQTLTAEFPALEMAPLEGTYLAWLDLGAYVPFDRLHDFVERECRVAPDYGEWFWPSHQVPDCHIRLNLATPRSNVEEAVRRIGAALRRLK